MVIIFPTPFFRYSSDLFDNILHNINNNFLHFLVFKYGMCWRIHPHSSSHVPPHLTLVFAPSLIGLIPPPSPNSIPNVHVDFLKCTGAVFSEDRNPGRSCGNRQTKLTNQGSSKRVGHVANIFLFHDASVVWTACSRHICEGMLLNCRPSVWVLLCLLAVGPPCNFSNPRPCSV